LGGDRHSNKRHCACRKINVAKLTLSRSGRGWLAAKLRAGEGPLSHCPLTRRAARAGLPRKGGGEVYAPAT